MIWARLSSRRVMLRQGEKLATLGKLSAGMAHELNNPVAAVLRGTEHIATALADQTRAHLALDRGGLTPARSARWTRSTGGDGRPSHRRIGRIDPGRPGSGVGKLAGCRRPEGAWEVAPGLVNMGLAPHDLEHLAAQFDATTGHVLDWAVNHYTVHSVLREISEGSDRVAGSSRRSRPSPIWIRRRCRCGHPCGAGQHARHSAQQVEAGRQRAPGPRRGPASRRGRGSG
ncbi:MAG: hypothetical protein R2838_25195 [Caldilineaceae bacterium]